MLYMYILCVLVKLQAKLRANGLNQRITRSTNAPVCINMHCVAGIGPTHVSDLQVVCANIVCLRLEYITPCTMATAINSAGDIIHFSRMIVQAVSSHWLFTIDSREIESNDLESTRALPAISLKYIYQESFHKS